MSSFTEYENFSEFITKPLDNLLIEGQDDINYFRNKLRCYNEEVKGEIRKNCQEFDPLDFQNTNIYITSIRSKLEGLQQVLFKFNDDGSFYSIYHKIDPENELGFYFIESIRISLKELENFIDEISVIQKQSISGKNKIQNKQTVINISSKKAIKKKQFLSFKLLPYIEEEDINQVCRKLKLLPYKTIAPDTTENQFYQCFSGERVQDKVKWLRNNVLHFFITEMANSHLMISPENRIWELASLCFIDRKGGDLTPRQLGRISPLINEQLQKGIKEIIMPLKGGKDGTKKTR